MNTATSSIQSTGSVTRLAQLAGVIGPLVIGGGSIIAALAYSGSKGEPYSPLSHWVSELGEQGVSEQAAIFNLALMFGGVCFVIFIIGLGIVRGGKLALVYTLVGILAGIGGFFVGVYPMNNLDIHGLAALTFFNLGWVVVGLASFDFVRRPDRRFPRWLVAIGALTVAAFIGFLAVLLPLLSGSGLGRPDPRPDPWIVAVLEWAVLIGILVWVFATALSWWRAESANRST